MRLVWMNIKGDLVQSALGTLKYLQFWHTKGYRVITLWGYEIVQVFQICTTS